MTRATASPEDTEGLATRLASHLLPGDVIALVGDLGAGKTVFVRGVATGLGIDPDQVASPTFTMIAEYHGGRLPLFHVDLYRLAPGEVDVLSLREYVFGDGVTAIEWADRLPPDALPDHLLVRIAYAAEASSRVVAWQAIGSRAQMLLAAALPEHP